MNYILLMLSTTTQILTTFSSKTGGPYRQEEFLAVWWVLWWFYFDFWWDTWEAEATRKERFRAPHSTVQHCVQPWLDGLEVWQQKGMEQLLSLNHSVAPRWEQSYRTHFYQSLPQTKRQRMNISMQVHSALRYACSNPSVRRWEGWQAAALCGRAPPFTFHQ